MSPLTPRLRWALDLWFAELDLEIAEADALDHDGSEIGAPERIAAAKLLIETLKRSEPPK